MGFCLDSTPEMGEYSVEVRRESFYLQGEPTLRTDEEWARGEQEPLHLKRRHGIITYEHDDTNQGTVEILLEDIPKLRAALDEIENYIEGRGGPNLDQIVEEARAREEAEKPVEATIQKVEF